MTAPGIKEAVDAAQQGQVEPPRPLLRDLPPADPFPLSALGSVLGGAAEAIVDLVQCPAATAGQSVLGAATLATQGHANVELPHGRCAPLSNYYVTVDELGGRKSEADRHALWPIRKREEGLRAAYDVDLPLYEQHREAWEHSDGRSCGRRARAQPRPSTTRKPNSSPRTGAPAAAHSVADLP